MGYDTTGGPPDSHVMEACVGVWLGWPCFCVAGASGWRLVLVLELGVWVQGVRGSTLALTGRAMHRRELARARVRGLGGAAHEHAYVEVEDKRLEPRQALSGGLFQRQIALQAAPSVG